MGEERRYSWEPEVDPKTGEILIPLTQGYFARIDAPDLPLVADRVWYFSKWSKSKTGYAYSNGRLGEPRMFLMHRVISGAKRGEKTDHWDGDGLNNTRRNLRVVSHSQNMANRQGPSKQNRLGVLGVYFDTRRGSYRAQIRVNKRKVYLGSFKTLEEAAAARRAAEILVVGRALQPK